MANGDLRLSPGLERLHAPIRNGYARSPARLAAVLPTQASLKGERPRSLRCGAILLFRDASARTQARRWIETGRVCCANARLCSIGAGRLVPWTKLLRKPVAKPAALATPFCNMLGRRARSYVVAREECCLAGAEVCPNSLLTKSPGSDSLARRERAGVRLWQWGGKESARAR
jgi:hypothetical protein